MTELLDEMTPQPKKQLHFSWPVILIWILLFFIGYFLRVMHWPFGNLIKITGAGGFMAYSLSILILVKPRSLVVRICNLISLAWIIFLFWGLFFNNGYPLNFYGLNLQIIVFVILAVLHLAILFIVKKTRQPKN